MIKPLILDVLKQLKIQVDSHNIPYYLLDSGICFCTENMLYEHKVHELARISLSNLVNITFKPYFEKWPKFSGNEDYPIPDPFLGCPRRVYWNMENMWVGEYGALRIELLDFLISELEKEIEPA